jgi:23S rRNA (uracil-5-)-methyltransferase RumA
METICPYFGRCGGCSHQDTEYGLQLAEKTSRLEEAIGFEDLRVYPGRPYEYRSRMDFVFHSHGLGLREQGAFYKFVDIERCAISNPELNSLLAEVREHFSGVFYFDVRRRFGAFCYAVIRTPPGDSSVSIVLNRKDRRLKEAVDRVRKYAEASQARNVLVTYVPHNRNVSVSDEFEVIKGADMLSESYLERRFLFPVQGFFQVNHAMAIQVHAYCMERLSAFSTDQATLLDLFGGVGTFGILNAAGFKRILILENYPPAVQAAERNIAANRIANAETICRDARYLHQLELPRPLFVILDPPRSGIHPKTLRHLKRMECEAVLYVSCNPKLLGRDLKELDRFRIRSAALFDMFPQTPHMEAVVELVPR